jgi:hypothetical protein
MLVVATLRHLEDWTTQARDLLDTALRHVENPQGLLDTFAWQLKAKAPAYAIDLLVGHLDRTFRDKEARLPRSEPLPADASQEDWMRWYMDREPAKTIKDVFHAASCVHVMGELAAAAPEHFLRGLLPWVAAVLSHAAEADDWHPAYRADHICDCSEQIGPVKELPHALRTASETLAVADPARFLALCADWLPSDLQTVHVILSYGYERLGRDSPHSVAAYILGDERRLLLGEAGDQNARSLALLRSIRATVGGADVQQLERAIQVSQVSSPSLERPLTARRAARTVNREHRLRLLQALPPALLSRRTLSHIEQEARVFGEVARGGRRVIGFKEVGSSMSAAQMERAADADVLRLFDELPDSTGFHHPTRFMEGGAIEAGRELAVMAKKQPERALALIERLAPQHNETPVGLALEALAQTDLSTARLCEAVATCHRRGFASEQFRDNAASALGRRAGDESTLPEDILDMFRAWLAEVPHGARTKPRLAPQDSSGSPPFLSGSSGFISLPAGNYTVLDTMLVALLSAKPPRAGEWIQLLNEHVERDENPCAWTALAHRLEHLRNCDSTDVTAFLSKLFVRYPEVLECTGGVHLLAWAAWWVEPSQTQSWLGMLAQSDWQHAPRAAGELIALLAIRSQPLPWAEEELRAIVCSQGAAGHALGAAEELMSLWHDPPARERACPHLCALVRRGDPSIDAVILSRLAHDDVGADDLALEVLNAFATRAAPLPMDCAHDIVSWLARLVHASPAVVHQLLAALVSTAAANRDAPIRLGGSSVELVNMALTLQRMPDFREQGLTLLEQLLELDLYGARGALDELDLAKR